LPHLCLFYRTSQDLSRIYGIFSLSFS
jgi:hypothetical protein